MDTKPFSQTAKTQESITSPRRSARIDYITTLLLSGRDEAGTPFREFTQTSIVNLHGCKVRTSYRILVGMLVTLECPKAGTSAKGVCVRVWDPPPGVAGHEIAIQLIKPQNVWGVPNPPPDWEIVIKAMTQGRVAQTERTVPMAAAAAPYAPATAAIARTPSIPPAVAPMAPAVVAPVRPTPVAGPTIEQCLAELERRSTQLVESVLDTLRRQAEEVTRNSLEEFRQQVEALIQDAEGQMRLGLRQAYEDSAASLIGLRTDLMDQMASRGAQMIRSSEDTLRTRLRSQLAIEDKAATVKPPAEVTEK